METDAAPPADAMAPPGKIVLHIYRPLICCYLAGAPTIAAAAGFLVAGKAAQTLALAAGGPSSFEDTLPDAQPVPVELMGTPLKPGERDPGVPSLKLCEQTLSSAAVDGLSSSPKPEPLAPQLQLTETPLQQKSARSPRSQAATVTSGDESEIPEPSAKKAKVPSGYWKRLVCNLP